MGAAELIAYGHPHGQRHSENFSQRSTFPPSAHTRRRAVGSARRLSSPCILLLRGVDGHSSSKHTSQPGILFSLAGCHSFQSLVHPLLVAFYLVFLLRPDTIKMRSTAGVFAGLLSLGVGAAAADPTWPAATDEIEEIVYQLKGFKARLFSDTITPCSNEASGPGRQNAAEWLRIGFHDMSTANTFFGTGGLDASIQFELSNGENTGPGHNTTLQFLSNYYSTRASMSDLIAAGVAASVRSCNGPVVPLRLGRVDATGSGNTGVPQPQNAAQTFVQQFDRMGFSVAEMIQVTACGHTLEALWDRVVRGDSGAKLVTRFPVDKLPYRIAAEIGPPGAAKAPQ